MPYSLLLVGADEHLRSAIMEAIKDEFSTGPAHTAKAAIELVGSRPLDAAVLLADPPDMDSLVLLRVLRATEKGKDLPVVVASPRDSEERVLEAFGLGADDFLPMPFDPRELKARLLAVLRRRYALQPAGGTLSLAGVELDPSRRLCRVEGRKVRLQPREFELLEVLMRKAGRVLSRAYLLEAVWGMSHEASTHAVDVMVSRLRKRLGPAARLIETVSKLGYCFAEPE